MPPKFSRVNGDDRVTARASERVRTAYKIIVNLACHICVNPQFCFLLKLYCTQRIVNVKFDHDVHFIHSAVMLTSLLPHFHFFYIYVDIK